MAIRPLRSIDSPYLMHMVVVLLWPLGWAVAALITQGILDFMTDPSFRFIDPTASLYSLQATFGVVVAAFWIVFSTISAPLVIQKVIVAGELAAGHGSNRAIIIDGSDFGAMRPFLRSSVASESFRLRHRPRGPVGVIGERAPTFPLFKTLWPAPNPERLLA